MTLSEIIPDARNLTAADKLRLIRILADEVDPELDIEPLQHGRTYTLATPAFEPGAPETLMRELQAASLR